MKVHRERHIDYAPWCWINVQYGELQTRSVSHPSHQPINLEKALHQHHLQGAGCASEYEPEAVTLIEKL